jgi:hypothetical protein
MPAACAQSCAKLKRAGMLECLERADWVGSVFLQWLNDGEFFVLLKSTGCLQKCVVSEEAAHVREADLIQKP